MEEIKNKILEILKGDNKKVSLEQIVDTLGFTKIEDLKMVQNIISELEDKSVVVVTKKKKIILFENTGLKKGRLLVHRSGNFGFVDMEDGLNDIRIEKKDMVGASNNDLVVVQIDDNDSTKGRVFKILERDDHNLVGECYLNNGAYYIKFDNPRYEDCIINLTSSNGIVDGSKVLVKRVEKEQNIMQAEVIKVLGHKDDVGIDILSIVYESGIDPEWPIGIEAEINNLPTEVSEKEIVGRKDLRNETLFTIDGDDSKDFDDAVSIKKLPNGNYNLGVHIADVSHYVKEDSEIGREAYKRGTSVYLVDRVIPMLPHPLSNGICSLNEKVDRLVLTWDMEIDSTGKIVNKDIYKSVMNSKKRMTYNKVNQVLEKNEIPEGYEPFVEDLKLMKELAEILRKNKTTRGYLDFDIDEMKIIVDELGEPLEITRRERGTGEKLIEDFMIAANEATAQIFTAKKLPLIYRVHEVPDQRKVSSLMSLLSALGFVFKINPNNFKATDMQLILSELQKDDRWLVLGNLVLRTMKKAIYSTDNVGHFGLGSDDYAQSTSPIRRLPDLYVHRSIKRHLLNESKYLEKVAPADLAVTADHSSMTEDGSVKCERAVEKYESAKYMAKHINEEYDAIISGIGREGIWIQLPNLIEGLVKISEIGDEYYEFDEKSYIIKGSKSGSKYVVGQKIRVSVVASSLVNREIDFGIVKKETK